MERVDGTINGIDELQILNIFGKTQYLSMGRKNARMKIKWNCR